MLDSLRRPDGDTLDQYLNRLVELDEIDAEESVVERQGQIRPGGLIDMAQQSSLRHWVSAGLLSGEVWYFDGHVIEYTGRAKLNWVQLLSSPSIFIMVPCNFKQVHMLVDRQVL